MTEITFKNSPDCLGYILKLEKLYDKIQNSKISDQHQHQHHHKDSNFHFRIDLYKKEIIGEFSDMMYSELTSNKIDPTEYIEDFNSVNLAKIKQDKDENDNAEKVKKKKKTYIKKKKK